MEEIIKKFGLLAMVSVSLIMSEFQIVAINKNIDKLVTQKEAENEKCLVQRSETKAYKVEINQLKRDVVRLDNKIPTTIDWFALKAEVEKLKN